jgi:hypothetical protein
MADDTSTSKADVENWRRGYEAALTGEAFLRAHGERTSAWRLGYRDGRASRLKQHAERNSWMIGQSISVAWCRGQRRVRLNSALSRPEQNLPLGGTPSIGRA